MEEEIRSMHNGILLDRVLLFDASFYGLEPQRYATMRIPLVTQPAYGLIKQPPTFYVRAN